MVTLTRSTENPILLPSSNSWEKVAAFNGCVIKDGDTFRMVYRALSPKQPYQGVNMEISTVGYAESSDGIHFSDHRQLIKPEHAWERFGCEDPRITKIDDTYFIFYTALSTYPFSAEGIKVALALTKDFVHFEKHPVTPFNAKAMSLFPEKINGKYVAILTANTDLPPSKICIALFDTIEEIWSSEYWHTWYTYIDDHVVQLQQSKTDQIEIGAPPLKSENGWLLIYSHIKDYYSDNKIFGIQGALLNFDDPRLVVSQTNDPMLLPEEDYERYGIVPNIAFPSGALIHDKKLYVYYGGADTVCCLATCDEQDIVHELHPQRIYPELTGNAAPLQFERFDENPIIAPIPAHAWEAKGAFNPAAVYEGKEVHIIYRAQGADDVSSFGYASSSDGFHIDERLPEPVYIPRESFELKTKPGNSGCEDPRITKIGDTYYMCYTAYDGLNPPRVALTSIKVSDFLDKNWKWEKPKLISPPGVDDKDACLLPKKINGKYVIFHRLDSSIWIDFVDDLSFTNTYLEGKILLRPRPGKWDKGRIGISAPPIETKEGWLLFYHGIGDGNVYRVGAVLLDLDDPLQVIAGTDEALFEPETTYEKVGQVNNVVFPCSAVVIGDEVFLYYGGADSVVGVATINLPKLMQEISEH